MCEWICVCMGCAWVCVHGCRRGYVCMSMSVYVNGGVWVWESLCGEKRSEEDNAFCGGFLIPSSALTKQPRLLR